MEGLRKIRDGEVETEGRRGDTGAADADERGETAGRGANRKPINSRDELKGAADGTIYFRDHSHQNSASPQGATHA